jgi:hypothetical protein
MIYDHFNAIQTLNYVHVHMPDNVANISNTDTYFIALDTAADGFHLYLYASFEACGLRPIKVYPVLFNVGINEQSVASNLLVFALTNVQHSILH